MPSETKKDTRMSDKIDRDLLRQPATDKTGFRRQRTLTRPEFARYKNAMQMLGHTATHGGTIERFFAIGEGNVAAYDHHDRTLYTNQDMAVVEGFLSAVVKKEETEEAVNHPGHYGGGLNPYEAIKVILAWKLGFNLGNAVKYISRAGKKDPAKHIEDLEKARWYLDYEIEQLKSVTTQAAGR